MGKVRPGKNVCEKRDDSSPYELSVDIERKAGFLEIEQSCQTRATHLVSNSGFNHAIKSAPPGNYDTRGLNLLDKTGRFTSN